MRALKAVAGGEFFCNICGTTHASHNVHGDITPLKKAQLACEAIEEVISRVNFSIALRKKVKKLFSDFRSALGIPQKTFYEDDQIKSGMVLALHLDSNRSETQRAMQKTKEEEKKNRQYNPSISQRKEASVLLDLIEKTAEEFGLMEESYEQVFADAVKRAKNELNI